MIEAAYQQQELPVWTEDEAGPYQTLPSPGSHWHSAGQPVRVPHEYVRSGTAKQLTLFHPASGAVRVKGVTSSVNAILHPWIEGQLTDILATLPEPAALHPEGNRRCWVRWQEQDSGAQARYREERRAHSKHDAASKHVYERTSEECAQERSNSDGCQVCAKDSSSIGVRYLSLKNGVQAGSGYESWRSRKNQADEREFRRNGDGDCQVYDAKDSKAPHNQLIWR